MLRVNRIVLPQSLRQQALQLAHEGHRGAKVTKLPLRAKVRWPLVDRELEKF